MSDHYDPDILEQRDYEAINAANALELNKARQEIERLTAEHGDMNVYCVKMEKENERLQARVEALERSGEAIAMYSQSLGAVDRVNFERGIEKALAATEQEGE